MRAYYLMLSTLLLSACEKPPPGDASALELRTYEVPKGTVRGLQTVVKDVFWMPDKTPPVGRATITPDGRLAVVAPRNVQAGVERLVEQVSKSPPAPEQTIELHYWLLVARPATSVSPAPPGTMEIEPALAEIQRSVGPQTFSGIQRVALSTLSDEPGRVEAANLKIQQHAVQTSDGVFANITIDLVNNPGRLDTKVHLVPGQVVVLAATRPQGGDAGENETLYYLVRVAPHPDGRQP
jgi:hypothetical protein